MMTMTFKLSHTHTVHYRKLSHTNSLIPSCTEMHSIFLQKCSETATHGEWCPHFFQGSDLPPQPEVCYNIHEKECGNFCNRWDEINSVINFEWLHKYIWQCTEVRTFKDLNYIQRLWKWDIQFRDFREATASTFYCTAKRYNEFEI